MGLGCLLWTIFYTVLVDCPPLSHPSVSSFECILKNYHDCHLCPDWKVTMTQLYFLLKFRPECLWSSSHFHWLSMCVFLKMHMRRARTHTHTHIHSRLKLLGQDQLSALVYHLKWDPSVPKGLQPLAGAWQTGSRFISCSSFKHRQLCEDRTFYFPYCSSRCFRTSWMGLC